MDFLASAWFIWTINEILGGRAWLRGVDPREHSYVGYIWSPFPSLLSFHIYHETRELLGHIVLPLRCFLKYWGLSETENQIHFPFPSLVWLRKLVRTVIQMTNILTDKINMNQHLALSCDMYYFRIWEGSLETERKEFKPGLELKFLPKNLISKEWLVLIWTRVREHCIEGRAVTWHMTHFNTC